MNCPHCQTEVPADHQGTNCSACSKELASRPLPTGQRVSWWLFFAVLLAPTLLTVLTVTLAAESGNPAPAVGFLGSIIAGIICGGLLGRRLGKTSQGKVALGFGFAVVMFVVSFGMSCFGCLAGGYHLDMR